MPRRIRKIRGITELPCTKCGETKPIAEFSPRNTNGSWFSACKKCCAIKNAEIYKRKHKSPRSNKNGYPGVVYLAKLKKYSARMNIHGKQYYLGYTKTPEEAAELYRKQKEIMMQAEE